MRLGARKWYTDAEHFSCTSLPVLAIDGLATLYSVHPRELYNSSEYAGRPLDPDVDEAWRKLLQPMDIRVTASELARNSRMSVRLPEGGGYLAWLGVFHELHCLVKRTAH